MPDAFDNFCDVLRNIVSDPDAESAVVVAAQKCLETTAWQDIELLMEVAKPVAGRNRLMSAYAWLVVERDA